MVEDHDRLDRLRAGAMRRWWRKVGNSSELARARQELHAELNRAGEHPDPQLRITRRSFIHRSLLAGAAGAATYGWFPTLHTLDLAYAQQPPFKFAWVSDNHLYPKDVNTRFVEKTVRAFKEVQAMNPPADFMIHGGDLAQLGDPVELDLGADLLKEVKIQKRFIPGEHDWYLDMGQKCTQLFGPSSWTFDHKGVRFVGLDTVSRGPDYWTAKKMTPKERMGHMATLDGRWPGRGRGSAAISSSGSARRSPPGRRTARSSSSATTRSTSITRPGTSGCGTGARSTRSSSRSRT